MPTREPASRGGSGAKGARASGRAAKAAERPIALGYDPRHQFIGLHLRKERWAVAVAHRRAGKTVACIADLISKASTCRRKDGRFAYIAPQLNQAKDIAWHYLLEYTEPFAPRRKVNASELWVELPNNRARIRLYGADNPDRLRGLYLDGVVLDEYGDMEPGMWARVIRPLLSDREGWATFIGTPRGKNAFWKMWKKAGSDPDWMQLTLKASETRLLSDKELADVRKTLDDEEYAQEYECSFDAAVRGAYWGKEIAAAEAAGRIAEVPFDPALRVHTAWDLGMADSTVIWLFQPHGLAGETRVIDVIKGEGVGLDWYASELDRSRERHGRAGGTWLWGDHFLPHDAAVRELGTGKSRIETLRELGIHATICPNLPVEDGIQAVRQLLPRCWFDRTRCARGIEALRMYRRDYDERRQEYGLRPVHDWTSHYADAFRYFAVGYRPLPASAYRPRRKMRLGWIA
ncbi:terminase large subunit domain-containing protein [Sphingosinicella terrae]|uniref:terminase large subunit domain-containing protein n=1 Tax=Sphingosinicella terrae TaxID=2172047 RepID=UPI000E0D10F4|nr:terminase family protein [Sphingosinicella terrae]